MRDYMRKSDEQQAFLSPVERGGGASLLAESGRK